MCSAIIRDTYFNPSCSASSDSCYKKHVNPKANFTSWKSIQVGDKLSSLAAVYNLTKMPFSEFQHMVQGYCETPLLQLTTTFSNVTSKYSVDELGTRCYFFIYEIMLLKTTKVQAECTLLFEKDKDYASTKGSKH